MNSNIEDTWDLWRTLQKIWFLWQNDFFIEARSCFFAPCEGQICANVGLTLNYSRASDCRGLNSEWISRFLLPRFSATSCPPYLLSVETQPVVLRLLGVGYPSHRFTLNLQHSTLPRPPSAHNRSKMPIFLQTNSPLMTLHLCHCWQYHTFICVVVAVCRRWFEEKVHPTGSSKNTFVGLWVD